MSQRLRQIQEKLGRFFQPIIISMLTLLLFLFGFRWVIPQQVTIRANQVAEVTIRAPYTTIDEQKTEENRNRAQETIADIYSYQASVREEELSILEQYFGGVRQMRKETYTSQELLDWLDQMPELENLRASIEATNRPLTQKIQFTQLSDQERLLVLRQQLLTASDAVKSFAQDQSDDVHQMLLSLNDQALTDLQSKITSLVSTVLAEEIYGDQVDQFKQTTIEQAQASFQDANQKALASAFLEQLIVPTVTYDDVATQEARQAAADQVQSTYILQGQVIVQEGFVTDSEMIRLLNIYGLMNQNTSYINLIVYGLLLLGHAMVIFLSFRRWEGKGSLTQDQADRQVTAYALSVLLNFILLILLRMVTMSNWVNAVFMMPSALMTMLLLPKSNRRTLSLALIFFSLISLFVLNSQTDIANSLSVILYFLLSNIMLMVATDKENVTIPRFKSTFISHLCVSFILLLALNFDFKSFETYQSLGFMLIAIIGAHFIYFFVKPYWDQLFDDKALLTLNQLANLNHPLLKDLIEEAPGTYHHSILVSNLSANAVEAIGGDSLFTRVASYYHDIGKVKYPLFFVENLPGGMISPHQMLSPQESAQIIIGHVNEGAKILKESGLPQSIIDVCQQHHGTTLVSYFYHQAINDAGEADRQDFTYPGPIPQTKETAVIMIADSVEAASRSLKDHSQASIEQLVSKIIEGKIADNQFADCGLTVHELKLVKQSLVSGLAGMFHTRIEYPD